MKIGWFLLLPVRRESTKEKQLFSSSLKTMMIRIMLMIVMIRVAHFQSSHRADACNCKAVVNNGDGAVDEPVGLAGPVLGKGAVQAEVPVLPPVWVSHLSS